MRESVEESLTQNAYIRTEPRGGQDTAFANLQTGWPCQQPPWGELMAINLNTGDIAWRVPFGRIDDIEVRGIKNTGSLNIGGSVATAGGLLFIGASTNGRFHAYESKTGKLLWETKLAAQAQANPITSDHVSGEGRQAVRGRGRGRFYRGVWPTVGERDVGGGRFLKAGARDWIGMPAEPNLCGRPRQ